MKTQLQTGWSHGTITPNLFGISYGLAGLATCWGYAAMLKLAPAAVAVLLFLATAVAWVALTARYARQVRERPGGLLAELADPVFGPFVSLVPIVGMLVAIGVLPYAHALGSALFGVFAAITTALAGWMVGQWIIEDLDLEQLHPGYVLPTVAGGLVAAIGAALVGWPGLAHAFFGFGLVSWLALDSVILTRLFFRPPLPRPLTPTLAIEVAPPALAGLAYLAITHGRVDAVALALGGYTLLAVIVQLRLIPVYRRVGFVPGFWSFAFSYAAVATFALHWLNYGKPAGYRLWSYLVLLAITAFIAALAVWTVRAIGRGGFLPSATGRPRPTAGAA
jgi:tellurite resistance protein